MKIIRIGEDMEELDLDTKVSWFSITGFAVLIILLSGLL